MTRVEPAMPMGQRQHASCGPARLPDERATGETNVLPDGTHAVQCLTTRRVSGTPKPTTGTLAPIRDLNKRCVEIGDQALEIGPSHRLSLVHPKVHAGRCVDAA